MKKIARNEQKKSKPYYICTVGRKEPKTNRKNTYKKYLIVNSSGKNA